MKKEYIEPQLEVEEVSIGATLIEISLTTGDPGDPKTAAAKRTAIDFDWDNDEDEY